MTQHLRTTWSCGHRALLLVCLLCTGGCASFIASATGRLAENLSTAILEQDDPALVRDAVPAYLLLLDSLVLSDGDNQAALEAAAQMYAAYAVTFADDEQRARKLSSRSRDYGRRALCIAHTPACTWDGLDYDGFVQQLAQVPQRDAGALYVYTVGWLAWLRAHAADWSALTDLPKVEAALLRLENLDVAAHRADVNLYLGILNTLRPPALGGEPERGRKYFERAIQLSGERDLAAKVEYARGYARLIYDRELHDRLLHEVLEADPRAPERTLSNILAQEQARELLETADEYF